MSQSKTRSTRAAAAGTRRGVTAAALVVAALAGACPEGCGDRAPTSGEAPSDTSAAVTAALAGLPPAKIADPLAALPHGVEWALASPDALAWHRFATARPLGGALAASPLVEDLRVMGPMVALQGVRHQIARVARVTGGADDEDAIFSGPVAIGAVDLDAKRPRFVVVKRIDPTLAAVARLATAFASLAEAAEVVTPGLEVPTVETREVEGTTLRVVSRGTDTLAFALFRDTLIFGSDTALVEVSVRLANGSADASAGLPSTALGRALGDPAAPGVHVGRTVATTGTVALVGAEAMGTTLTLDAAAPAVLRVEGGARPAPGALELLRYAPTSTFVAVIDGRPLATGAWAAAVARRDGEIDDASVRALLDGLEPGTALLAGVLDDAEAGAEPAVAAVARIKDRARVEPLARAALAAITDDEVARTVLESHGGAILLTTTKGPTLGLTADALVAALDEDRVRAVIAAGGAQAPRLLDRAKIDVTGEVALGVYVDATRGARFLQRFYTTWATSDPSAPAQAMETLAPTFSALEQGGHAFARLTPTADARFAGELRVLP